MLRTPQCQKGQRTTTAADFILEDGKTPIFVVSPASPSVRSWIAQTATLQSSVQWVECATHLEAASLAKRIPFCLVITRAGPITEVVESIKLLKFLQLELRNKSICSFVITQTRQPAIDATLKSQGCTEVSDETASDATVHAKIDACVKFLQISRKNAPTPIPPSSVAGGAAPAAKESGPPPKAAMAVRMVKALALASDCWLFDKNSIKKAQGYWLIRMLGPAQSFGHWEAVPAGTIPAAESKMVPESGGNAEVDLWRWVPSDAANDPFIKEEGEWIFRGRKPEFQDNLWQFIGTDPMLAFLYEGTNYGARFALDRTKKTLQVSENSRTTAETLQSASKKEERSTEPEIVLIKPLTLESDCWLLHAKPPRRVNKHWLIKLIGPTAGRWLERKKIAATGEAFWAWTPEDPDNDPFIKEEGEWIFRGIAPKLESDGSWLFMGQRPELAFYYEGKNYGAKLSCEDTICLKVAKDSQPALDAMPLLDTSQKKVVRTAERKSEPTPPRPTMALSDEAVMMDSEGDLPASAPQAMGALPDFVQDKLAKEYRFEVGHFGIPGGIWEFVYAEPNGDKYFLYLGVELLNSMAGDVKKFSPYWTYVGRQKPKIVTRARKGKEWLFTRREPVKVPSFSDLPRTVQTFLLERTQADAEVNAGTGGRAGKARNKALAASSPFNRALEMSVPADFQKKSWDYVDEAEAQDDPNDFIDRPDQVGPEGMRAQTPAPSLSPLALAFLISELMGKPGMENQIILERYCAYVSASSGGLRVEVWINSNSDWVCAATHNGSGGEHTDVAEWESDRLGMSPGNVLIAPVSWVRKTNQKLLGALTLSGEEIQLLPTPYAHAAGHMLQGLLRSVVLEYLEVHESDGGGVDSGESEAA